GVYPILGPKIFGAAGIDVKVTLVPTSTADMTPQAQTLINNGVQEVMLLGAEAFCISAAKALRTLGFTGLLVLNPSCNTDAVHQGIGNNDNVRATSGTSPDPNNPEVVLYKAVMAKYAPGERTDGLAAGGYAIVLAMVRAMSGISGDVTPASVEANLES